MALDLPTPGADLGTWGTKLNNALNGTGPGTLSATYGAAAVADDTSELRIALGAEFPTHAEVVAQTETVKDIGPASGLRAYRNARMACDGGTGLLNIVVLGDSLVEGYDVGATERWVTKVRDLLRARWQPAGVAGGEGYVPAWYASQNVTDRFTFSGTAQNQTQYGLGMRAAHLASGTNTMTATFTGTSFTLHYTSNTNTGIITITIDGGAPLTVNTDNEGATTGGGVWTSPALTAGAHTVVLSNTSGKTNLIEGITVYNGDETAGLRMLEGGHSGWTADDYANDATAINAIQSLVAHNPHLVIVALGFNDINTDRTAEQFRVDLTKIVTDIRTTQTNDPSILIAGYHPRQDQSAEEWHWYQESMRDVAATEDCAYVDLARRLSGQTDVFMPDGVHPNADGHTVIANAVDAFLASV